MKVWREGDVCEAYCCECGGFVPTTMRRRDVGFSDNPVVVPDLLVDVCDRCDTVVSVPPQATPQIRAALFAAHEAARAELARSLGLPDESVVIDLPQHPTSRSLLDVDLPAGLAQATYSPSEGYGLYVGPSVFMEQPEIFLRDAAAASTHLKTQAAAV